MAKDFFVKPVNFPSVGKPGTGPGINRKGIWSKTVSVLNPFSVNAILREDSYLCGTLMSLFAFGLFQLLAGKLDFRILLGWLCVSDLVLYVVMNMPGGRYRNLDLCRCLSWIGYYAVPIVILSVLAMFLPLAISVMAGAFIIWSTRVCNRLMFGGFIGESHLRKMGGGCRTLSIAQVRSLLEGVELFGKGRWSEIKRRIFLNEEHLTTDELKIIWKNLVRMAKKPSNKRRVDYLAEEIWAQILNFDN